MFTSTQLQCFLDISQTSDDSWFLNTPGSASPLGCFPVGFSTGEHLFPYSQQTVPHPAQHGNLILMIHIFDLAFHGQMPLMTQTSRFIWAWDRQLARASRVAGEDVSQTSEVKSRLSLKKEAGTGSRDALGSSRDHFEAWTYWCIEENV